MTDSGRNAEFITLKLNCLDRGLRVIFVYGAQEYGSEENSNDFYDSISVEIERCYLNGDSFILAGDVNAKLGSSIIKNDIHLMSQNGGQLYRLILKYNLCLLNSSDMCHGLFTFARDSNGKKDLSVTDYIFVSPDLNQCCKSMMIDEERHFTPWRKLKTHKQCSDHNAIKFQLDLGFKKLKKVSKRRKVWGFDNPQDWNRFKL